MREIFQHLDSTKLLESLLLNANLYAASHSEFYEVCGGNQYDVTYTNDRNGFGFHWDAY